MDDSEGKTYFLTVMKSSREVAAVFYVGVFYCCFC